MSQLLLYSLIGGLFSLIGGVLLLWRADLAKKIMLSLLAFAAGAFLGASFLDILPEALESASDPHPILIAVLVGFVAYFALERILMRRLNHSNSHTHGDHTESLPALVIIGDAIHNFLDGVVIALSFLADPAIGLVTTLVVAAHEIPQEIGDFSILLNQGWSKRNILAVNVGLSLLTVVGAALGYYAGARVEQYLPLLLAGTAGIFVYLAASDLVPEIHHQAGHKHIYRVLIPLILGIVIVGILGELAHAA